MSEYIQYISFTTHQPQTVYDNVSGEKSALYWDANGNLAQMIGCKQNSGRLHEWDEENRLRFVLGEKFTGYYGYDANGERVYKLTGQSILGQVNSGSTKAQAIFDDAVLYPNPYVVVTSKGYTKHYYAGTERIATVIGGGGFGDMVSPTDKLSSPHDQDIVKTFYSYYQNYDPFFYQKIVSQQEKTEDIFGKPSSDLDYLCTPTELVMVDILNPQDILLKSISINEQNNGPEKEVYFYHGDHLGSANWITDYTGAPIQYIHYAPYGELIDNQVPYGYNERYKFTGKERDAETGYDYFGARYLWGDAGTWLSVDRFANKYPGLSPYAYCAWNPVRNIDIHGDSIFIVQGKNNLLYKDGKLYNSDNTLYTGKVSRYTKSVMQAFENISATAEGNAMISELQNSTNNFYIRRGESNKFKAANPMAAAANLDEIQKVNPHASSNGSGGYIYWNPYSTCGGLNENGNTDRPAYIGLAHEFIHARDANNGGLFPSEVYGSYTPIYDGVLKCEWRAVYFENIIRSQAGLPLRTYYGYRTDGSTYWGVGPKMLSPDGKLINYPIF